jgi:hypothetical protein
MRKEDKIKRVDMEFEKATEELRMSAEKLDFTLNELLKIKGIKYFH